MIVRKHPGERRQLPQPHAEWNQFEHNNVRWVDITRPSTAQVAHLREAYAFHPLHIDDVLSHLQRPKIDDNPDVGYVFLVLNLPVFDKKDRVSMPSEVDIFAGSNFVITLHDGSLKQMNRLVQHANDEELRRRLMGRGSGYLLYRIIETLIVACFPMVHRIDQHLERIELAIFDRSAQQRVVEEMSIVRRDIIGMRRIIKPNLSVVRSLEVRDRAFLRVDEEAYFGDLTDALNKLWDMLEEQKEIVEGLNDTLNSLASYRLNREMRTFTLISLFFMPMTLVASIMGMNVVIPFANSEYSLFLSLAFMLLVGLGMYLYFRLKHWI